jgi:hypothetical protein
MLIELGRYVSPEAVVDLRVSGLHLTLANGDDTEAILKPLRAAKFEPTVEHSKEVRTYSLTPSGRPSTEEGVPIWSWVANYYWTPPSTPQPVLRKAALSLARISKSEYRLELEVGGLVTQYVMDRSTVRLLEEAYKLTRQSA